MNTNVKERQMQAVVKINPGYDQMSYQSLEIPQATGNLVKIKVAYTGICGSDIHTFKGEYANPKTPVTLGHEFSGTVVEVGENVTSIKVGDRVTSETTYTTCEECIYCEEKDYNLCSNRRGIGTQVDGSMSEYVLSREESVHILTDNITLEAAALSEPLACVVHAVLEKTNTTKDDTVLIFGPGPIGILLAQVVKAQGARVIMAGITKDMERLELAKELGVDLIVDTLQEDLTEFVMEVTDGYGADKVFDCSGAVVAVNQGLALTKKKGDFVQVGLFADKFTAIDTESIIQREINYIGCRSQKPSSWAIALDLLDKGKINTDKMITKVYDLKDWREAFETVMGGSEMKVLVQS